MFDTEPVERLKDGYVFMERDLSEGDAAKIWTTEEGTTVVKNALIRDSVAVGVMKCLILTIPLREK